MAYCIYMKQELRNLIERINTLQQIIDLETDDANAGCTRSRQLVVHAEAEKDDIQDEIDEIYFNTERNG